MKQDKHITVTRRPRMLCAVPTQSSGHQWVYQMARVFQLSPTEIGLMVNIRWCAIRPVDIEVGNDMVILDRLDCIEPKANMPLNRGEIGKHPRTGEPLLLSRYPLAGGFVPFGVSRIDGTPHPNAGTGFAMSHVIGYPVDDAGNVTVYGLWDVPEVERYFMIELQQYRYDGIRFSVEKTELFAPKALLPGWEFTSMPLGNCVPDGDDLLGGLVGKPAGSHEASGSGLARWQRRDDRWQLAAFTPVTGPDGAFEPSLVRDTDGSLLFTARGGASIESESGEEANMISTENDIRVWRSIDSGTCWELTVHARHVRAGTPVTINQALDGTIYIAGNPYRETDSHGQRQPSIEMRETLCLWPLAPNRRSLLESVVARDCNTDFGVPPYGSIWRADHPVGFNVRLADNQWHHLLSYRVLEQNECVSDAPATVYTGTYLEEITIAEGTQQ